jgi:hypothetical protein
VRDVLSDLARWWNAGETVALATLTDTFKSASGAGVTRSPA